MTRLNSRNSLANLTCRKDITAFCITRWSHCAEVWLCTRGM